MPDGVSVRTVNTVLNTGQECETVALRWNSVLSYFSCFLGTSVAFMVIFSLSLIRYLQQR